MVFLKDLNFDTWSVFRGPSGTLVVLDANNNEGSTFRLDAMYDSTGAKRIDSFRCLGTSYTLVLVDD